MQVQGKRSFLICHRNIIIILKINNIIIIFIINTKTDTSPYHETSFMEMTVRPSYLRTSRLDSAHVYESFYDGDVADVTNPSIASGVQNCMR